MTAYGAERAAIITLYTAKLASVAALPRGMQEAARAAIRAEERAALRALKDRAAAAQAAALVRAVHPCGRGQSVMEVEEVARPGRPRTQHHPPPVRKIG